MSLRKSSRPSKSIGGGCKSTRHRRRRLRTSCSDCKRNPKTFRSSWPSSQRDHFPLVVTLSITVFLLACSIAKEAPMLVNAFVHNINCRPSAQWNTLIQQNHMRQLPTLPHRILLAPLSAKQDGKGKDAASEKESSGLGPFFNRKDKSDDKNGQTRNTSKADEEEGTLKDVPLVGRFFATEEEKEEKQRIKEEQKEEKEQVKRAAKEELKRQQRESDNEDAGDGVVSVLKNYFRERQLRKDADILRFQVMRREEERQKQLEKDAEELRLEVQQREEDRKNTFNKFKKRASLKVPTAPVALSEDIVRRKIKTQKEMDRKRKERLEQIQKTKKSKPRGDGSTKQKKSDKNKDESDNKSDSNKSQRFGGVVSAAQKLVSGVFDGKPEEWIVIAPKTRISPGEIVAITAAGIDLLLIASKDGSAVHCVANSCPHLGTPLEVGSLERLPIESGPQSSSVSSSSFGNASSETPEIQPVQKDSLFFQENDIASMLKQDGCEDCIVCPLHKTAFALKSGEVRGEWCPYPPVIGRLTGALKKEANLPVFDVRTRGKNIEVRLNTPVEISDDSSKKEKKQ